MNFEEYQQRAKRTSVYPKEYELIYPTLGLCSETGDFANKVRRAIRDRNRLDYQEAVQKMGDILWYFSELATELGLSLDEIATKNLERLKEQGEVKKWD